MIEPKYKLGQTVYVAETMQLEGWVDCAECGGTGRWKVITAREEFVVACCICKVGYEPARGRVPTKERVAKVTPLTIKHIHYVTSDVGGVEVTNTTYADWSSGGGPIYSESRCFSTPEEAQVEAEKLCKQQAEADLKHFFAQYERKKMDSANLLAFRIGATNRLRRELAKAEESLAWHKEHPDADKA